jgi:OmpA-OmpF porin, OOP family
MYPSALLRLLCAAALLAILLPAPTAEAQLLRRVQNRVEQAADRAVTRAINGSEAPTAEATASAPQAAPAAPDPGARPGEGAWLNYDFVPGERVLFAEDFGTDRVGDFPRRVTFRSGNYEVAEWRGQRFLRGTAFGEFAIELPETLPDRFTLEFDVAVPSGWVQEVRFAGSAGNFVRFGPHQGGLERTSTQGVRAESAPAVPPGPGVLFPVRVMADGTHVKVYLADTRVANVPTADLGRSRTLTFKVSASQDHPAFFGNFRVAAGGLDLYDALAAEGRVVTQGVLFDTGSARIRPESTPTLKEIAQALQQYPALRLRIEGHTDGTGSAEANLRLSEERARAVVAYLVASEGIAGDRLEAVGLGQTQPVADDATPEGRQMNRRVELVRL